MYILSYGRISWGNWVVLWEDHQIYLIASPFTALLTETKTQSVIWDQVFWSLQISINVLDGNQVGFTSPWLPICWTWLSLMSSVPLHNVGLSSHWMSTPDTCWEGLILRPDQSHQLYHWEVQPCCMHIYGYWGSGRALLSPHYCSSVWIVGLGSTWQENFRVIIWTVIVGKSSKLPGSRIWSV